MTCAVAVTFAFDLRPPVTQRGTVEGGRASTCAHRAIEQAQKALKPVGWSSMNCVLLERSGAPDTAELDDSDKGGEE